MIQRILCQHPFQLECVKPQILLEMEHEMLGWREGTVSVMEWSWLMSFTSNQNVQNGNNTVLWPLRRNIEAVENFQDLKAKSSIEEESTDHDQGFLCWLNCFSKSSALTPISLMAAKEVRALFTDGWKKSHLLLCILYALLKLPLALVASPKRLLETYDILASVFYEAFQCIYLLMQSLFCLKLLIFLPFQTSDLVMKHM